jgi:hypothetical protein
VAGGDDPRLGKVHLVLLTHMRKVAAGIAYGGLHETAHAGLTSRAQ